MVLPGLRHVAIAAVMGPFLATLVQAAVTEPGLDDVSEGYVPVWVATVPAPEKVVVKPGDHLWKISDHHLEDIMGRQPSPGEIHPYWVRVVETNRPRIRSGDPDLIYPGEVILLPTAEGPG